MFLVVDPRAKAGMLTRAHFFGGRNPQCEVVMMDGLWVRVVVSVR